MLDANQYTNLIWNCSLSHTHGSGPGVVRMINSLHFCPYICQQVLVRLKPGLLLTR